MSRLKGFYILFLQERDVTASEFVPKCQKTFKTSLVLIHEMLFMMQSLKGRK